MALPCYIHLLRCQLIRCCHCLFLLFAAALRSAFLSLQRESPRNLLHQQLLSSSESPASWWCSQQRLSVSAATGSMIGWLLGLGDRHLDNLLLDTDTGELLHIDFSVCFDKGASLGVPEVVPFRLTQMMQVRLSISLLLLLVHVLAVCHVSVPMFSLIYTCPVCEVCASLSIQVPSNFMQLNHHLLLYRDRFCLICRWLLALVVWLAPSL